MGFKITIYIGKLAAKTQGGSRHNTRLVFKTKNMKHILKFDAKIVKFCSRMAAIASFLMAAFASLRLVAIASPPDGGICQTQDGGPC